MSYDSGGSCEAFDARSGIKVKQGDIVSVKQAIIQALNLKKEDILLRANEFVKYGDYSALYDI